MENMVNHGTGWVHLEYLVPARGLIGLRNEFLTETRGTEILHSVFEAPGEEVYEGMVIGENARVEDLDVNPTKGKQLTNIRAAGSDEAVRFVPHHRLSLDQALEFIRDDECVEVTPEAVRLRKAVLPAIERVKLARAGKRQARALSER